MDMTVHAEVQAAEQTVNGLQSEGNISLPLSSLYVAKANVRKKEGKMPIPDLAAAIKREGLLQNPGRHRAQGQAEGAHAWSGRGPTSLSGAHAAGRGR
jgi:hypothetical protein